MKKVIENLETQGGWIADFEFTASQRKALKAALPSDHLHHCADALIDRVASAFAMWQSIGRDPVSKRDRRNQLDKMLQNARAVREDLAKLVSDEHFSQEFANLFSDDLIAARRHQSPAAAEALAHLRIDAQSPRALHTLHTLPRTIDAAFWLLESALTKVRVEVRAGQSTEHLDFFVSRVVEAFEQVSKRRASHSRNSHFRLFATALDKVLGIGIGEETIRRVLLQRKPKTTG